MWKTHINPLLSKLGAVCFIMKRVSHILNIDTPRIVYFAHFHTLIIEGIIFWGTSPTMQRFLDTKRDNKNYVSNGSKELM